MSALLNKLISSFLLKTDGYKSYLAGIGMIGYAIYLLFGTDTPNVEKAIESFLAGLGVLGIGHKIAKNTAAQNVVDGPVTPSTLTKETDSGTIIVP